MEEKPGTVVIIYPTAKISHHNYPCCTVVNDEQQIFCPLINNTKAKRIFRVGTYLGTYEPGEVTNTNINTTTEVVNDLIPHADHTDQQGDRAAKSKKLLTTLEWSHLNEEEQDALFTVINKYNEVFNLNKEELGTIRAEPAKINVEDNTPVRSPQYRYPEKAKEIIAEMSADMEKRDIIEPSTSAW